MIKLTDLYLDPERVSVKILGESVVATMCANCRGSGWGVEWNREEQAHVLNIRYRCEICKGAKITLAPLGDRRMIL